MSPHSCFITWTQFFYCKVDCIFGPDSKGQCHEIFNHVFVLKDATHLNRQKRLSQIFSFRWVTYSIDCKVRNWVSAVCVVKDCAGTQFFFRYRDFHILNYCYWMCKHIYSKYLFWLIVPLKSVRNLQSTWLCWHHVRVVVDYANTVST